MAKYMIQKHHSSIEHFDLRLEVDGVYRSWAVPKYIPVTPGDKRLAVRVDDHLMDYALEAEIPEGEYGAGTQMLWDYGEWTAKDPIEEDKINFYLEGDRLEGYYSLIRRDEKNWILISHSVGVNITEDISVLTGRTMEGIRLGLPFAPQGAKLVSTIPEGEDWVYEQKVDGYRIIAHRKGNDIRLFTRMGKDWTEKYPEIVQALAKRNWSGWLDGELTYGSTFNEIQNKTGDPHFWVFDKPDHGGTLLERKAALDEIFNRTSMISVLQHTSHPFDPCRKGMEGLIAKRIGSTYKFGQKNDWVKYKCYNEQELVVGGYTEGTGKRKGMIGALLVGYYEDGVFKYAGKVGTGFNDAEASALLSSLEPSVTMDSPFGEERVPRSKWVKPDMVVQVKFLDWTSANRLRNPSFSGIREDKPAQQVFREYAMSHPDKVLFPQADATKADLAKYYKLVGDRMLPDLVDRPLTLLRCPDGVDKECFFQRNAGEGRVPTGLKVVDIEGKRYYALATVEGLQSLAQLNVAEIHPWNVRADQPDHPDQMIFDLDPSDGVPWVQTTRTAYKVREELDSLGLKSFVRTSGNKGLHIVVPLDRSQDHGTVRESAKAIAERVAALSPDEITASSHGGARRNRVYIDWLRNDKGATTVASWSTRARSDATIATPIEWEAVSNIRGDTYNIDTAPEMPVWANFFDVRQSVMLSTIFNL